MKAEYIVHWVGQDTLACRYHLAKARGIGEVLGMGKVPADPYEGEEVECTNCMNEAKTKAAREHDQ